MNDCQFGESSVNYHDLDFDYDQGIRYNPLPIASRSVPFSQI